MNFATKKAKEIRKFKIPQISTNGNTNKFSRIKTKIFPTEAHQGEDHPSIQLKSGHCMLSLIMHIH